MKAGQKISIKLIHPSGRMVETIGILKLEEGRVLAIVRHDAFNTQLSLDLVVELIEPHVGDSEFNYRGEIRGAILMPDFLWK